MDEQKGQCEGSVQLLSLPFFCFCFLCPFLKWQHTVIDNYLSNNQIASMMQIPLFCKRLCIRFDGWFPSLTFSQCFTNLPSCHTILLLRRQLVNAVLKRCAQNMFLIQFCSIKTIANSTEIILSCYILSRQIVFFSHFKWCYGTGLKSIPFGKMFDSVNTSLKVHLSKNLLALNARLKAFRCLAVLYHLNPSFWFNLDFPFSSIFLLSLLGILSHSAR